MAETKMHYVQDGSHDGYEISTACGLDGSRNDGTSRWYTKRGSERMFQAAFEANAVTCKRCLANMDTPSPQQNVIPPQVRNFLGKVQGVCMGVAMSGDDHPDPDGALMELVQEAQELLFPTATTEGSDNG